MIYLHQLLIKYIMTNQNKKYKIVRMYRDERASKTIKTGLTLKEAQAHCRREDTHEHDADGNVIWFDGYEQQ